MKHKIEELKLNNGARLINVIVKNLPISLVSVWFKAGSRFDPIEKEGLAHFLEHLYMKKTKKYSNEIQKLKAIESLGIKSNAYTSYETVHYYNIQQKKETFFSLEFLVDSINNYILDKNDIEHEKAIVINEMLENKLNPQSYIWNLSNQSIWQNSSMGKNFFGTKKSIKSLKINDLKEFIDKRYTCENCTFVIVGNEKTIEIEKFLNKNLFLNNNKTIKIKEKFGKTKKISILKNNQQHITISVAFKTFSINNYTEVLIMNFICDYLSNKWISKLIEELRLKRDIAYWIDGENVNFSDTGLLRFIYSCDKKEVSKSIKIVLNEIEKIKAESFKYENLESYKKSFEASLAIRFTDPYEYLWFYGWQATVKEQNVKLVTIKEFVKYVKKIKTTDIQKIASKYLTKENISISLIGNISRDDIKF